MTETPAGDNDNGEDTDTAAVFDGLSKIRRRRD